ncbi:hypothetical protein ACFS4T_22700 [Pseudomonas lini]
MIPVDPKSNATVAEHVFLAAGNIHPATYQPVLSSLMARHVFEGKAVYIDVAKAKAAGAKLVSTEEILKSLEEYKKSRA